MIKLIKTVNFVLAINFCKYELFPIIIYASPPTPLGKIILPFAFSDELNFDKTFYEIRRQSCKV